MGSSSQTKTQNPNPPPIVPARSLLFSQGLKSGFLLPMGKSKAILYPW